MIIEGLKKYRIWLFIGNQEIKSRYKRSLIGPLWITLGTILVLLVIGPVYSAILGSNSEDYIYYLSIGLIFWILFSSTLNSCCISLINNAGIISSRKMSPLIFVLKDIYREFIIFLHNFPIIIFLVIYNYFSNGKVIMLENLFFFLLSLILIFIFLFFIGSIFALICLRYRDLISIITNIVTVLFFVTPVIWMPGQVGKNFKWLDFNLANKLLSIFREPLILEKINYQLYVQVFILDLILLFILLFLIKKNNKRYLFWI